MLNVKTIILSISIFFLITDSFAQKTESVVGKWIFNDFKPAKDADSSKIKLMKKMFATNTYYFDESGRFATELRKRKEGTWSKVGDDQLHLVYNNGTETTWKITKLTKDSLEYEGKSGNRTLFIRTNVKDADKIFEKIELKTSKATVSLLCKKWILTDSNNEDKDETVNEGVNKIITGGFVKFHQDGKYESNLLGIEVESKWTFSNDNQSIIIGKNTSNPRTWNILEISEKHLVVKIGVEGRTFRYTAAEEDLHNK